MKVDSNIPGHLLAHLRRKFRLHFFVETGTGGAQSTELAACCFDRVFTCEIDETALRNAQQRLAAYHNIQFYPLHGPDFIAKVRPMVSQPAMWWLDAHWCGGPKRFQECCLLDELRAIQGTFGHSVILIDDANYMLKPPPPPHDPKQWPTVEQIKELVGTWNEPLDIWIEPTSNTDVLVITPKGGRP